MKYLTDVSSNNYLYFPEGKVLQFPNQKSCFADEQYDTKKDGERCKNAWRIREHTDYKAVMVWSESGWKILEKISSSQSSLCLIFWFTFLHSSIKHEHWQCADSLLYSGYIRISKALVLLKAVRSWQRQIWLTWFRYESSSCQCIDMGIPAERITWVVPRGM